MARDHVFDAWTGGPVCDRARAEDVDPLRRIRFDSGRAVGAHRGARVAEGRARWQRRQRTRGRCPPAQCGGARTDARTRSIQAGPAESLLPGVEAVGDAELGVLERQWTQPAITVLGLDVPAIEQATNQLLAAARAKVSIRLAPGQDPRRALQLVGDHLRAHTP